MSHRLVVVAAALAVVVLAIAVAVKLSIPSTTGVGAVVFLGIALWMFLSERIEWPCVVLGLYLGLLDGFLKLRTGQSAVSLGRDVLLYAIVAGFLARAALRGQRLPLPPLLGWVVAYVLVVLLQLFNPGDAGVSHTIASLKPHLEFVPLFFIGYALLQTPKRLQAFFVLLTVCALLNGIVAFVQLNLTPEQFASWGPGYHSKVLGTGDVSGRVYRADNGDVRTRPFGLAGDTGGGALLGVVSLGAALALIALAAQGRINPWLALLGIGPPLAIITGQGRSTVVAGVVALVAFVLLSTTARRLIPTLSATLLGIGVTLALISLVGSSSSSGVFDRYRTITPSKLSATTDQSRGRSIALIPTLIVRQPFGGGLGFAGPAASLTTKPTAFETRLSNGETGFTFLLSELGIPGLLVLLAFTLRLLGGAALLVRRLDPESRILVAGVTAGLAGGLTLWASGAPMSVSPTSPYFWCAAGILAYWITAGSSVHRPTRVRAHRSR